MYRTPLFLSLAFTTLLASCNAAEPAAAAPSGAEDANAAVVAQLPLEHGYYVQADTPCGEASNATIALVRRDGIGGCGFTRIESLGEGRYRVFQLCHPRGLPAPREYVVEAGSRYRIVDGAYQMEGEPPIEFRHCPQSSLPEWLAGNDISDVTG